jgi:mono/diheme cytochrome c family protein
MEVSIFTKRAIGMLLAAGVATACAEEQASMEIDPSEELDASDTLADASSADAGTTPEAGPTGDASGQGTGGGEQLDPLFGQVFALMTEHCVSCHSAGKTLDLTSPALAREQLVGVSAKYKSCAGDSGMPPVRVVAGAANSSLLMAKLEGRQECGKPMPPPPEALLSESELDTFRRWINAGAKLR